MLIKPSNRFLNASSIRSPNMSWFQMVSYAFSRSKDNNNMFFRNTIFSQTVSKRTKWSTMERVFQKLHAGPTFHLHISPSHFIGTTFHLHLDLFHSLADRWGTTGDFTTNFLHSSRLSAFHSMVFYSRLVHSLMLSSHRLL